MKEKVAIKEKCAAKFRTTGPIQTYRNMYSTVKICTSP
jgi:hypothetical protein